jgi:hypothetical protein
MSRRKRPKNTRLEVRALALRPATLARQEQIVEEIVDQLRPWKGGEALVTETVQHDLKWLLFLAPLEATRSNRTLNRIHARKLYGALLSIEELLATAPGPLRSFLENPLPSMTSDGKIWPINPPSLRGQIERANKDRADSFRAELKRMGEVCCRAINNGLGYHPNYDPTKRLCAQFARGLMDLSKRTITGTKDSTFRANASLLYEAVSGRGDADLKRACDAELRAPSGYELVFYNAPTPYHLLRQTTLKRS